MAKICEIAKDVWGEWVLSRPPIIQDLCKRFPPDRLYLLKSTGHRVTIFSYSENGTVTAKVLGKYNLVMFERMVFGIKPEDLEECDLPDDSVEVGAVLTEKEDIESYIDFLRKVNENANRN